MMRYTAASAASLLTFLTAALASIGCTKSGSAATAPQKPDVEVTPVAVRDVPIFHEWIGTLDGSVNAAIKAQVTGYLLSQSYAEGSFVRKGQLLFQIDPRPFQAAIDQTSGQLAQANGQVAQAKAQLAQAQAQLVSAEANQERTQLDEDRYTPLAAQNAITQQDFDNARQNNRSAKAQVEAAKAQVETAKAQIQAAEAAVEAAKGAVETARVNLDFTHLTAPIEGIAGVAHVQIGNLVSASSDPVTTVSTLDPIKAVFTVSEQEYLAFARRQAEVRDARLELILADQSVYPRKGRFSFADRQVNTTTGSIQMTGLFPNPGNILRPGQYAKVRAAVALRSGALLVPQRAVTELQGIYQVAVVDSGDRVRVTTVHPGDRIGSMWVIDDGVKAGERVVVEGVQKVAPGLQVSPKLVEEPEQTKGGN
jgi:membrane fusion protein (multidrug efflux system)